MTFGSTFGRVFSPTFQPKSQAVAVVSGDTWWDLNGTITSCVAAYQAKGAADYAASKVNLANPGTYNATDGTGYPSWNASTGWTFDGSDDYLNTGLKPGSTSWSYIIRFSNAGADNYKRWWGARDGATANQVGLENRVGNTVFYVMNGGNATNQTTITADDLTAGWLAICGNKFYAASGVKNNNLSQGTLPDMVIYIGKANNLNPKSITVQAFAVYNEEISASNIALIAAAMNAL
jgi:hypothetical protein